jgi:hypothetical protein
MLGLDPLSLVARFICRIVANSYFNNLWWMQVCDGCDDMNIFEHV